MTNRASLSELNLAEIVRESWKVGQTIELSGIGYGQIHWGNSTDVLDSPFPYYYFLAGLVRNLKLARILEIGTHSAGSTRAMWRGLASPASGVFATVDISSDSDRYLADYPGIKKVLGDANSRQVFSELIAYFADAPVDLVYIDAEHATIPTLMSFALYATLLKPKFMVFDDITHNDGMRSAWKFIQSALPSGDTLTATEIEPDIRETPGFGIVVFRSNL